MNPLKAGDIAPKFSLPDQDKTLIDRLYQGQRVLVYFYPESHDPRLYRTGLRLTR